MVMTDPIADMLTRIRNANKMRHQTVDIPASKAKKDVLSVLLNEGFIVGFEEVKLENKVKVNGYKKKKEIKKAKKEKFSFKLFSKYFFKVYDG